ncbi:unnamed protein product [Mycena citricolor]|uniref:RRM domain-containing protein n=1 Tax=Mycena citricolor TaxID=2018698 RepID=A0AAD2HFD4_9AGAR|nr:unnamed protein product [Mycena citricolor]
MSHLPSLSGPIFRFSRETNAVRVEHIPLNTNRFEILSLFKTLVGEIRTSRDLEEGIEITFYTADAARKALCMSGYSVAGFPIQVTSVVRSASPLTNDGHHGRRNDQRRNLYVLGIPFGMTNQSLASLFSAYGTVAHCVILATLDGASRRRGFVVMSTHEEAKQVMAALGRSSRNGISGMDISWAVVQRSKGFLDGGDRAGVISSSSLASSPVVESSSILRPFESEGLPSPSPVPTTSLLIFNLPSLLFGSKEDLRGLVCPFGSINDLRLITLGPSMHNDAQSTAAVVRYCNISAAQESVRALDGESYAGCTIRAIYLVDSQAEPPSLPSSPLIETPTLPDISSFGYDVPHCSQGGPPSIKSTFSGRNVLNRYNASTDYNPLCASSFDVPTSQFPAYGLDGLSMGSVPYLFSQGIAHHHYD